MEISARSYLTAGMTTVVAAGAIAMAPALPSVTLQSVGLPAPAVAEIALTGTSLPLEQIWTLVQTFGAAGSFTDIVNGVFGAVGTEFVAEAMPLVTAVATDVATYLGAALTGVIGSGGLQIDFPGILSGVGASLGTGDFPGALKAVNDGLSAPLTHVVQTVFGSDFQAFLSGKVGTVLGALPEILRSAVQKILGLDIKPVTDAISAALSGLLPGPGASTPVALAVAEAPMIVPTMAAIRPAEPATKVAAVVAEAPSAPGSAAAVPADVPAQSAPVESPTGDAPAVTVEAPDKLAQAEPATAPVPARVAHRGPAEADGASTATPKPGARRGASDASSAAAERAGR